MWMKGRAGWNGILDVDAAGTTYAMPFLGYGETVRALIGILTSRSATLTWPLFVGNTKMRLGVNEVPAATCASAQHMLSHVLRLYASMGPPSCDSLGEQVFQKISKIPDNAHCWTGSPIQCNCYTFKRATCRDSAGALIHKLRGALRRL